MPLPLLQPVTALHVLDFQMATLGTMYGPAAVRKRYAVDSGSRLYVSGLFGRLVGRGLDGAYARALVSLIRRLEASHLCHQTLGAFISSFHSILGRELL